MAPGGWRLLWRSALKLQEPSGLLTSPTSSQHGVGRGGMNIWPTSFHSQGPAICQVPLDPLHRVGVLKPKGVSEAEQAIRSSQG